MKITITLDEIIRAGDVTMAAVARRWVDSRHGSRAFSAHGAKWPVAVLTRRDDVTAAFEIDGRPIDPEDFDRRFPGLRAAFETAQALR